MPPMHLSRRSSAHALSRLWLRVLARFQRRAPASALLAKGVHVPPPSQRSLSSRPKRARCAAKVLHLTSLHRLLQTPWLQLSLRLQL